MRIGIITDILDMDVNITGPGVYAYNLIKNLNLIDKENEYYLIHYKENDLDIYKSNEQIIIPANPWGHYARRNILLPLKLKNLGLDVVHDLMQEGFLSFNPPFSKIITIHDLTFLHSLKPASMKGKIYRKLIYSQILKGMDRIIAVSQATERDLVKYFKLPEEKIRVIYEAVDERFKPLGEGEIAEVKQKYALDFPFILYVGLLMPKKNIPNLIRAYHKLRETDLRHKLVIVGRKVPKTSTAEIFETVDRLNLQRDVIFTEYVPGDDLPGLYNAADLFVFPSLFEGFGLPPLEAMACGTPVITSNVTSLPEVVGDAGITVNPYDADRLAEAMHEVLTNEGLREEMIEKGLKRAKTFSLEKEARETLRVYEEVGK